jgi:cyclopentanol dehydrogenase
MRLENKVAFISGGARGMGAAEVCLFVREGARVAFGDLLESAGRDLELEIRSTGGEALFVPMDVAREEDWRQAIAATVERFGGLNILVNNAGILSYGGFEDTSVETWDQVMAVNAKGVFLGTKVAIPEMRTAGGGSIINISSQMGLVGSDAVNPAYSASKGAVRILTKVAALRHTKDGIRVNSVHPGVISTPMSDAAATDDPNLGQWAISRTPLGRLGLPEEVAYGVLYLASDESSYVTGAELVIDGGWVAQ